MDPVALADAVLDLVADRAVAAAARGRLDDEVVAALAHAGLNRAVAPAELGGTERPLIEVIDSIARIGRADGSTAWCAAISVGSGHFAGYVPEPIARRDFDDLDGGGAGMFAPAGVLQLDEGGGATLDGRWPFTSNCLHSRWIGLGAMVRNAASEQQPIPRFVIVPAGDVTIEETWTGAGLRATGSHHVRADGLRVDPDRSCTFGDRPWPAGTLWQMPLFTVLAPILAAAPLGIAEGAVDRALAAVAEGAGRAMGLPVADDHVALAALGTAHTALRAARRNLEGALQDAWAAAQSGSRPTRKLQAEVILAGNWLVEVAVQATSTAHRLAGGAAAYEGHPQLVALRDVETARQHILFSHQHRVPLTRIAAGIDEPAIPFVL